MTVGSSPPSYLLHLLVGVERLVLGQALTPEQQRRFIANGDLHRVGIDTGVAVPAEIAATL